MFSAKGTYPAPRRQSVALFHVEVYYYQGEEPRWVQETRKPVPYSKAKRIAREFRSQNIQARMVDA